jgi:hypothetical protein
MEEIINFQTTNINKCKFIDDKAVDIYDFDNTVFNSVTPNEKLWDENTYKSLLTDTSRGGLGWFEHLSSLDNEYLNYGTFNEEILKVIKESTNFTVLLTGRDMKFEVLIHQILHKVNIKFDLYEFKPIPNSNELRISTFEFKKKYILNLLKLYDFKYINLYEDRPAHIIEFQKLFTNIKVNSFIHAVENKPKHLKKEIEKVIVNKIINKEK